jgi:hypothetical protein
MPMKEFSAAVTNIQFVKFRLNRCSVPILRVLNQEDHQERHDGCSGIDDQLPCI